MPSDVLLPLFALTLIANAALVAFAIRDIRRAAAAQRRDAAGRVGSREMAPILPATGRPEAAELDRAIAARRAVTEREPMSAAAEAESATVGAEAESATVEAEPVVAAAAEPTLPHVAAPTSAPEPASEPASEPVPAPLPEATATPDPSPAPRRAVARATSDRRAATRSGGRSRRKFALPPLDDDHDRVNRSIETFFGGAETGSGDGAAEPNRGPAADPLPGGATDPASGAETSAAGTAGSSGATTVALIAVDGLPPARRGRPARTVADDDATVGALAMVERTIRAAARGTDVVSVTSRGRYRIVLAATGEVAARAYLKRIRATVEPLLESADRPLRLAVATATVLDEPIGDAVRRAGARLTAALAALAPDEAGEGTGHDEPGSEPRPAPRAAAD